MPWQLPVVLFIALATFSGSYLVKPLVLGRGIRTVLLLCVAAFCLFGFLASFEYPGITPWKVLYCALGVIAVNGATLPWLRRTTK